MSFTKKFGLNIKDSKLDIDRTIARNSAKFKAISGHDLEEDLQAAPGGEGGGEGGGV